MSRAYRIETHVKTTKDQDAILDIIDKEIGMDDYGSFDRNFYWYSVETSLCGGESELECHKRISKAIKTFDKKAKVKTIFTYLEELPFTEYGDEV